MQRDQLNVKHIHLDHGTSNFLSGKEFRAAFPRGLGRWSEPALPISQMGRPRQPIVKRLSLDGSVESRAPPLWTLGGWLNFRSTEVPLLSTFEPRHRNATTSRMFSQCPFICRCSKTVGETETTHFPVQKCCHHFETVHLFSVTKRLLDFLLYTPDAPGHLCPPGSRALLTLQLVTYPVPSHSSLHSTGRLLLPGIQPPPPPSRPVHLLFLLPERPFPLASLVPDLIIPWSSAGRRPGWTPPIYTPQHPETHYTHL